MFHRPGHGLGEARYQTITTLRAEVDADIQQAQQDTQHAGARSVGAHRALLERPRGARERRGNRAQIERGDRRPSQQPVAPVLV
jgi:hypothetical protein